MVITVSKGDYSNYGVEGIFTGPDSPSLEELKSEFGLLLKTAHDHAAAEAGPENKQLGWRAKVWEGTLRKMGISEKKDGQWLDQNDVAFLCFLEFLKQRGFSLTEFCEVHADDLL